MAKNKLERFEQNYEFGNMVQPTFKEIFNKNHKLKGRWAAEFFGNENPIVLELGCGRGEYSVALGEMFPERNYLGVDIKGARMWHGAKRAYKNEMSNVGFLRTQVEFVNSFFGEGEIEQIWLTFPDPQLRKRRIKKRLVSPLFLGYYAQFLKPNGVIHLKTDSQHLHDYTKAVIEHNGLTLETSCSDIYGTNYADQLLSIKTAYERNYLKKGLPISYLRFSLGGRVEFTDPEFEPDELL